MSTKNTYIGYLALIIWCTSAYFASSIKDIPVFQSLTITLGLSFISSVCLLTVNKKWKQVRQPKMYWFIGILGIYGNDILYLSASKLAPISHIGLISYLWPIFVITLSTVILKKIVINEVVAVILGFLAIYNLSNGVNIDFSFIAGYTLAILGAFVWALYIIFSRKYNNAPPEMIGLFCGVGAVFSLFTHLNFEMFVMPNTKEFLSLLMLGIFNQGIAYILWDVGVKKGNFKLLTILSYGNPLIVTFILLASNEVQYSHNIIISTLLMVLAGVSGHFKNKEAKVAFIK
jgi:drug/metabolite transporter (DMT)-like permease